MVSGWQLNNAFKQSYFGVLKIILFKSDDASTLLSVSVNEPYLTGDLSAFLWFHVRFGND